MWSRCQKLVRAQERRRLNRTWKVSIFYTWLVKTPQRAFFFCTFSCSCLALIASTVQWLRYYLYLNAANHRLHSVLNSAKYVRCGGPATLSYPSSIVKKCRSSLSSIARHPVFLCVNAHMMHEFLCVHVSANWPFWVWQTRTYVRTYIARMDPSFK